MLASSQLLDNLEGIDVEGSFILFGLDAVVGFSQFLLFALLVGVVTELIDPPE